MKKGLRKEGEEGRRKGRERRVGNGREGNRRKGKEERREGEEDRKGRREGRDREEEVFPQCRIHMYVYIPMSGLQPSSKGFSSHSSNTSDRSPEGEDKALPAVRLLRL